MQVHSPIPDPDHTVTGPQTAPTAPHSCNPCPPLPLGSGALQVSLPDGSQSSSLGIPTPASTSTCPFPRCRSLSSPLLISLRKVVHHGLFVSITFGQCHGKELFLFPAYSYCFPGPNVFRILLYPTWEQKPLGILADAKKNFRGIHCYRAKN